MLLNLIIVGRKGFNTLLSFKFKKKLLKVGLEEGGFWQKSSNIPR